MNIETDSALFDYVVNGGDELALAKATIEHMDGVLGREIELGAKARAALQEIADTTFDQNARDKALAALR